MRGDYGPLQQSTAEKLVVTLLRFSRRSTVHGFNHMAQAKSAKRRIFWLIISLSATIGFVINLFYLFEKFLQTPILTSVYHDAEPFQFPDITFCQINPIYFPPEGSQTRRQLEDYLSTFEQRRRYLNYTKYPMSDHMMNARNINFTHPPWSSIISCKMASYECTHQHFELRTLFPYGSCYTLNPEKIDKDARNLHMASLDDTFRPQICMLVYKALQYPKQYQTDVHEDWRIPSGIMLIIHEQRTYPFIGDGIIVDGSTQIELKVTEVNHLAKLGKCEVNDRLAHYTDPMTQRNYSFIWRPYDCIVDKMQPVIARYCECQVARFAVPQEYSSLPDCANKDSNDLNECQSRMGDSFNTSSCYRDPCTHTAIRKVIAQSSFPAVEDRYSHATWLNTLADLEQRERNHFENRSDLAKKALVKECYDLDLVTVAREGRVECLNVDFVNRNFMMIRIVPSSLYMDKVVESEEYPLSRLVSDVGGSVGLWVGASLITFFECVDLLFDFVDTAIFYNWNGRPQHKKIGPPKMRPPTPPHFHTLERRKGLQAPLMDTWPPDYLIHAEDECRNAEVVS